MKKLRTCFTALFFSLFLLTAGENASAQCAMCSASAENMKESKGQEAGRGMNNAIFVLMAMPYVAVGVIGFLWYRNYKKNARP